MAERLNNKRRLLAASAVLLAAVGCSGPTGPAALLASLAIGVAVIVALATADDGIARDELTAATP